MARITIPGDAQDVSDGCHTFRELYAHRNALFAVLAQVHRERAWRSRLHADGTMFDGWFIAGLSIPHPDGPMQVTYHIPEADWSLFDGVETLDYAPEWDGHTAEDTYYRLRWWSRRLAT